MTGGADAGPSLRSRLERAVEDPELATLGEFLELRIRLVGGEERIDVTLPDLIVESAAGTPDIEIRADPQDWQRLMSPVPPPGFQSFTAVQLTNPAFSISGTSLAVAQARAALERLTELLRENATPPQPSPVERDLRQIAGGYRLVESGGETLEIYCETAGAGVPLVMLHTAGADSRQYQEILSDVELARRFRLFAFDLPFHGRSFPPASWRGERYALDQATYARWVADCLAAIADEPAVLMGCSMGAAIALVLSASRPDLLKSVIALEPPLRSRGRRSPYLAHPAVNAGQHNAAYVRSLMSPASPEVPRRRAAWIYAQAGPGIYSGDLAFYSDEFDAEQVAPHIDAQRCPITLMTGAYDYSASPEDGARIAELIPGSRFIRMDGLGHFPMTENCDLFRSYLMPVLDELDEAPGAVEPHG